MNETGKAAGWEQLKASDARDMMYRLGLYPTRNIDGDKDHDVYEQNIRQWLPGMVEQFTNRNDLICIYWLVELLLKCPPGHFVKLSEEEVLEMVDKFSEERRKYRHGHKHN